MPRAIWCTCGMITLFGPGHGSHQLCDLVTQFFLEPSMGSVIMADLALTLSQASSVSVSTLQAATINTE